MRNQRHPSEAELFACGQGSLDASDRDRTKAHVERCDRCRQAVAAYCAICAAARRDAEEIDVSTQPGPLERALALRRAEISRKGEKKSRRRLRSRQVGTMNSELKVEMRKPKNLLPSSRRWSGRWSVVFALVVVLGGVSGLKVSQWKTASSRAAAGPEVGTASQKEAAMREISLCRLKQLGIGLYIYSESHGGALPPMATAEAARSALEPFVDNESFFVNPESGKLYQPNSALDGKRWEDIEAIAPKTLAFYDPDPLSDGTRLVAFLDGHVARLDEDQWEQSKQISDLP